MELAGPGKRGPKPPRRYKCHMCGGTGTVSADPKDRRKGQRACPQCRGDGEV